MKRWLLLVLLSLPAVCAADLPADLDRLKDTLAAEVATALQQTRSTNSYTVVWREYEDAAIAAFCAALKKHVPGLTDANFDAGQTGSEKNRLADLAIVCSNQTIEISVKAARRTQNPENDLGTFRDHPNRHRLFVAAFMLWIRYDDSRPALKVDRVFFDRSYRFVGKSTLVDGVKYRKKDGNMRPKSWAMFDSGESFWNSEQEFEAAMKRSEKYRANSLIQEHLDDLTEDDQRLLYEELQKKFDRR
jgi:hypothetical protein